MITLIYIIKLALKLLCAYAALFLMLFAFIYYDMGDMGDVYDQEFSLFDLTVSTTTFMLGVGILCWTVYTLRKEIFITFATISKITSKRF